MRKGNFVVFLLLLSSCGAGEKRDIDFSKKGSGSADTSCPLNYNPISLLRDGMQSIASPDLLPKGRYEITGSEYFLRQESGENRIRAHFLEEVRAGGILNKKVCTDPISSEVVFDAVFPNFLQMVKGSTASSYLSVSTLLQGQNENIRLSKSRSASVNGSIAGVLQEWDQWKIYQTGSNSYEFRFSTLEIEGGDVYRKMMLLRFQYFNE